MWLAHLPDRALTALVFFTCTLACGSAPRTASKRTVNIGMLLPADATPAPVLLTDPSVKTIEDGNCELACESPPLKLNASISVKSTLTLRVSSRSVFEPHLERL